MKKCALVMLIGLLGVLAAAAPGDARDHRPGGVVVSPSVTFGFGAPYPYPYPVYAYPDPYWYPYAVTPRYYPPYAYAPAPSYCPSLGAYAYQCPDWRQSP